APPRMALPRALRARRGREVALSTWRRSSLALGAEGDDYLTVVAAVPSRVERRILEADHHTGSHRDGERVLQPRRERGDAAIELDVLRKECQLNEPFALVLRNDVVLELT